MVDSGDIKVTIEGKMLECLIPLFNPDNDDTKAKIVAYGALKVAEEQVSIYFMRREMQRQALLRNSSIIKPGLA
jgi:hypothetical protein